jgi:two-component system response regulator FixJ
MSETGERELNRRKRFVVIVDDDEGVRDSTSVLLGLAGHQVKSFPSGSSLVEAGIPEGTDVILLDLMMPGLNGLETLMALGDRSLPAIVMLTGHGDIPLAVEAMKLGASDFLEKPYPSDKLLELVSSVKARPQGSGDEAARNSALEKVDRLTPRQRDILKGLAEGEQSKVTAHRLDLSVRTVEAYRGQLFSRLGVRSMADAVKIALLAGLAEP